jgi:hypothetical protein
VWNGRGLSRTQVVRARSEAAVALLLPIDRAFAANVPGKSAALSRKLAVDMVPDGQITKFLSSLSCKNIFLHS